jgi:hypothetical protein
MQPPDRLDNLRLVWALIISLLVHAGGYGIYEGGRQLHLWERLRMPAWVEKLTQLLSFPIAKHTPQPPPAQREPPLMFVEVNPALAVPEPPKNAKYYAAQSTRAANPDAEHETDAPQISGEQERIMRTENTQLSKAQPLQPAPVPAPDKNSANQEEAKPKPTLTPGDLTMGKPGDRENKSEGDAPKPKPRTVAEAKARLAQQQRQSTAGERTKQDGGVRRRSLVSSLDAIGSPFGAYDAAVIAAVQERWYGLLEERSYASDRTGKVVLEFRLNYDGRVTDIKVVENTVDEMLCLLCQKAIVDPAPFGRWPSDMRRMVPEDYREVRFTFYYN